MPYDFDIPPDGTRQLAELQQLCVAAGESPWLLAQAAFDDGMSALLEELGKGQQVVFPPLIGVNAPVSIPNAAYRDNVVRHVMNAANGASPDRVYAEAFRRGLDALTTEYTQRAARVLNKPR
jgi:hypothetical protein